MEPKTHALQRQQLTVNEVLDAYIAAGCPKRKLKKANKKATTTIATETKAIKKLRAFFRDRSAGTVRLKDADEYRNFRANGGYEWKRFGKTFKSKAGDRLIDLELQSLGNAFAYAVRTEKLNRNPIDGRPVYQSEDDIRHCREVAPEPDELSRIVEDLRRREHHVVADVVAFLASTGLRINEALCLGKNSVDWETGVINVKREKKGINPWVPILEEMGNLLTDMLKRNPDSKWLFPSPDNPSQPIAYERVYKRLVRTCQKLGIRHVTPHGLRSYFVTRCREAGLPDTEVAALIGDKSGAAIIERTYGAIRSSHLMNQVRRVRLLLKSDVVQSQPDAASAA